MFFPPPGAKYEEADLSPIAVGDGEITFTKTFKLLGSMLAYDLKDNDAIDAGSQVLSSSVQKELRIHTRRLPMKGRFSAFCFMVVKHGA